MSSGEFGPVTLSVGPCGTNLSTWYTARDRSSGGTTWSPINNQGLCLTVQANQTVGFEECTPGTYDGAHLWGFNTAGGCFQALFTWDQAWCLTVGTPSTTAGSAGVIANVADGSLASAQPADGTGTVSASVACASDDDEDCVVDRAASSSNIAT
jgi:hypothetical protein